MATKLLTRLQRETVLRALRGRTQDHLWGEQASPNADAVLEPTQFKNNVQRVLLAACARTGPVRLVVQATPALMAVKSLAFGIGLHRTTSFT